MIIVQSSFIFIDDSKMYRRWASVSTPLNSTVQYSAVQYSTAQYSTVQYSTVQYSIMPQDQMTIVRLSVKNDDAAERGRGYVKWEKDSEISVEKLKYFSAPPFITVAMVEKRKKGVE